MEQIIGEIRDNFRTLADGFQKLDKFEDSGRQSRLLENLTENMRECKRLIEKFDHEIEMDEGESPLEVSKKLKDEKQSMIKALNSYMSFIKIYQNILGNKKVELFIMETGNSKPMAEENARVSSGIAEMDQAIELSNKVVYEPVILGIQTADTLKSQVSIKMESELMETGYHVSTNNLPNNSLLSSSSEFTEPQYPFQQFQQQPLSQQMPPPLPEPSRSKKPASKTPWTQDDETRLAQCWALVSEETKVKNSPSQESFWYRVRFEYNMGANVQRRKDQLSSKWRDMNQHVTKFNDLFVKLTNARANDGSDLNVTELALETYLRDEGHAFMHLHAWNILKDKRKWLNPDPVILGRRNKKRPTDVKDDDSPVNLDGHDLLGNNANSCPPKKSKKRKRPTGEEDLPLNLDDHELPCPTEKPNESKRLVDEENSPINFDDCELIVDDAILYQPNNLEKSKSQRSSSTGVRMSEGSSHDSVLLSDRVFEKLNAILGKQTDLMDQKIRLEQLKFLAFKTDEMLEQDRILVEKEKAAIRDRFNL
ncbi:uncharacterized protein [Rutidosis leptorrhynchoides]|uniref:uncharacterized protein isoform X2 n=1 Tax=Rutidosis leptorrhynchoides TaxID=125765 RepID=UPI003A98EB7C